MKSHKYFEYATQFKDYEATIRYLKIHNIPYTTSKGIGDTGTQYEIIVESKYEDYLY